MGNEHYLLDLQAARQQLTALEDQREQIENRIARMKRRIALLTELADESDGPAPTPEFDLGGLTEACGTVLRAARKEWLTAGEVQSELKQLGFPLDKYKAPAAVVTTTLNRMAESGRVVADKRGYPAATEYKWAGAATRVLNAIEAAADKAIAALPEAVPLANQDRMGHKIRKD